jgi:hypothetical protein
MFLIFLFFNQKGIYPHHHQPPTTKTGRHDIAEILLKVALNTKNQLKKN